MSIYFESMTALLEVAESGVLFVQTMLKRQTPPADHIDRAKQRYYGNDIGSLMPVSK